MKEITTLKKLGQWTKNNPGGFVYRKTTGKKKRKKLHKANCRSLKIDYPAIYNKMGAKNPAREPIFECYVKTEKIPKELSKKQQCLKCKPCTT